MTHGQTGFGDVNSFFDKMYRGDFEDDFGLEYFDYQKCLLLYRGLFGLDRVKIYLFEDLVHRREVFVDSIANDRGFDPQIKKGSSRSRRKLSPISHFTEVS